MRLNNNHLQYVCLSGGDGGDPRQEWTGCVFVEGEEKKESVGQVNK